MEELDSKQISKTYSPLDGNNEERKEKSDKPSKRVAGEVGIFFFKDVSEVPDFF